MLGMATMYNNSRGSGFDEGFFPMPLQAMQLLQRSQALLPQLSGSGETSQLFGNSNGLQHMIQQNNETGEESLTRLRKRRIQVAEASRRSRAKRKKEFSSVLELNTSLQDEVNKLKKRLHELENSKRNFNNSSSLNLHLDQENDTAGTSLTAVDNDKKGQDSGKRGENAGNHISEEKNSQSIDGSNEIPKTEDTTHTWDPLSIQGDPQLEKIANFLTARSRAYFNQLKQDYKALLDADAALKNSENQPKNDIAAVLDLFDVQLVCRKEAGSEARF